MIGKVYLVGAGPGDPELLTLKGRNALASADVVIYDNLAAHEHLDWAPQAEKIYAGKKKADHAMPQEEICRLLVQHAKAGSTVVRLKGGDPYIFGRGGEEVEALVAADIPFEVVPGVTSALGVAAYAGVPLTHRDHTSSVTFVTGHEPAKIDWERVGTAETLVVYMGLTTIRTIAERLIDAGRAASTPAIAVERATTPKQRVVRATLRTIADAVAAAHLKPPATIVIGEVAALSAQLDWFSKRRLAGKTVIVTRSEGQSAEGASKLRALGALVHEIPMIQLTPPGNRDGLLRAAQSAATYDWLIFTSANAVTRFFEALRETGGDARRVRGRVCAIGSATESALESEGIHADRVAKQSTAEGVVDALGGHLRTGERALIPRAAAGRDVIPRALEQCGVIVEVVEAYRTEIPAQSAVLLESIPLADWVTFTSPSTVKNFLAIGGRRLIEGGARAASIGPVTSDALRAHGVQVAVEAESQSMEALVEAIAGAI